MVTMIALTLGITRTTLASRIPAARDASARYAGVAITDCGNKQYPWAQCLSIKY